MQTTRSVAKRDIMPIIVEIETYLEIVGVWSGPGDSVVRATIEVKNVCSFLLAGNSGIMDASKA